MWRGELGKPGVFLCPISQESYFCRRAWGTRQGQDCFCAGCWCKYVGRQLDAEELTASLQANEVLLSVSSR